MPCANSILSPAEVLAHTKGGRGKKPQPKRAFVEYSDVRERGVITILIPLYTPNPTRGGQWLRYETPKRRQEQRGTTLALLSRHPLPVLPLVVTLTRLSPGELDDDNLRPALKSVRDGVADALDVDDRDKRVRWEYYQRKQKAWGVEIRIERAEVNP
jgi:hypothetical protein